MVRKIALDPLDAQVETAGAVVGEGSLSFCHCQQSTEKRGGYVVILRPCFVQWHLKVGALHIEVRENNQI
jgi:hypothetical protein